jgi:hypothetical protein
MATRIPLLLSTGLLALSACGTPQERCIAQGTRELREIDALAQETAANLARGYAIEEELTTVPQWEECWRKTRGKGRKVVMESYPCLGDQIVPVERHVAIDPSAEARKLRGLQDRRAALLRQAQPWIKACQARYPE